MWKELKNQTDIILQNGNSSQRFLPVPPWIPSAAEHSNGSTAIPHPSHTETPLDRGSGIIPGAIAATVFIGLLLALYAVLWKCMGTPPKRKKKRKRVKVREQNSLIC